MMKLLLVLMLLSAHPHQAPRAPNETDWGMFLDGKGDIGALRAAEHDVAFWSFRHQEYTVEQLSELRGWHVRVQSCTVAGKPVWRSIHRQEKWICVRSNNWRAPNGFQHALLHVLSGEDGSHAGWMKKKLDITEWHLKHAPRH